MDIDEYTLEGTMIEEQADGKLVLKLGNGLVEVIRESLDDATKMNEVGEVIDQLLQHHGKPRGTKFAKLVDPNGKDFLPGLMMLTRVYLESPPAAPAGGKRRHRKTRGRKASKTRKH
jgi:hypothetical protein